MEHRDAQRSEVTVILHASCDGKVLSAVEQLKVAGLNVTNIDADNGVVEGDISSDKLHELKQLECVEAARITFNWVADYPPGDPRDKDGPEEYDDAED